MIRFDTNRYVADTIGTTEPLRRSDDCKRHGSGLLPVKIGHYLYGNVRKLLFATRLLTYIKLKVDFFALHKVACLLLRRLLSSSILSALMLGAFLEELKSGAPNFMRLGSEAARPVVVRRRRALETEYQSVTKKGLGCTAATTLPDNHAENDRLYPSSKLTLTWLVYRGLLV